MTAVAAVGMCELLAAQRHAQLRPNVLLALLGLVGPALPLLFPSGFRASPVSLGGYASIVGAVFLAALILEVAAAERNSRVHIASDVGAGLLTAAYVSLFGAVSLLRTPGRLDAPSAVHDDAAFLLVLLVLCCVWATDTAAYYVGCSLGSTKLAPSLSPNKTIEGAVAGLAAGVMAGALLGHFLLGRAMLGWWIGAASGIVGQLGDLFESGLKRELGIKDFSSIIPGHGGILDRFDSLLFTAPVVWILIRVFG